MTHRRTSSARGSSRTRRTRAKPLRTQLQSLEASGLIERAQALPEIEYHFRHALVQEAAYASLLKHQRRALHEAIGTVLEQVYPERLDELAPVLAGHFSEAEDSARALLYYTRAGDLAARRYALPEAIMHYARALELSRNAGGAEPAALQRLYLALGRALEMNGQYAAALQHYTDMESLSLTRADRQMELAALIAGATIRSAPTATFNPDEARALSERGLALAQQLGDHASRAKVLWNLSLLHKFNGDWRQFIAYSEQAAALARELNLRELLAHILNDGYAGYVASGMPARARDALAEANALWRELDNLAMLADNLSSLSNFEAVLGNYDTALAYAEEAYRVSCSINNLWTQSYALWSIGQLCLERGEIDRALSSLSESITLADRAGFAVGRVVVRTVLALLYADLGDTDRGLEIACESVQLAALQAAGSQVVALCGLSMLYARCDQPADADTLLDQARAALSEGDPQSLAFLLMTECELGVASREYDKVLPSAYRLVSMVSASEIGFFLGWSLYLKATILLGLGRLDEAYHVLTTARRHEESHLGRRMLWRILARLSAIEAQRGNLAEAQSLRAQARAVLDFILAHISDSALRASLLSRPEVRALLSP